MPTEYQDRLRIPFEGDEFTRFETKTGLHVATGYTRIVIGGRGPHVQFLPGHLIWDSLHIPDEEKYRTEQPWKAKVFYFAEYLFVSLKKSIQAESFNPRFYPSQKDK
jgi:hypothetical protein